MATALLLIDVINDFDFEDGAALFRRALPAARRIARLRHALQGKRVPTIYVNDNFGKWRSDFKSQVARCQSSSPRGKAMVQLLHPSDEDYFVLKPMHSGFFSTVLEVLLRHLKVKTLILTGFTSHNCVLFTANDAYLRGFRLLVPEDCVAASSLTDHHYALYHMRRVLKADTARSSRLLRKLT